jgi:AcrR family transcriptional regulator
MAAVKEPNARVYRGRTGDERTAARVTALVDAAFALVAEQGWRQLSIDAICRQAGLNKRYFYESFADLDAVIAAVTTRLADDAIRVTLAALDPAAPSEEATRSGVSAFVGHLTDDPRRARVLFGAVPAGDAAAGHRAAAIRQVITTVAAQGGSVHGIAADPAIDLAAAMLVGGTSQAVLDWLDGRLACSRTDFVDDLVALWQLIGDGTGARVRARAATGR